MGCWPPLSRAISCRASRRRAARRCLGFSHISHFFLSDFGRRPLPRAGSGRFRLRLRRTGWPRRRAFSPAPCALILFSDASSMPAAGLERCQLRPMPILMRSGAARALFGAAARLFKLRRRRLLPTYFSASPPTCRLRHDAPQHAGGDKKNICRVYEQRALSTMMPKARRRLRRGAEAAGRRRRQTLMPATKALSHEKARRFSSPFTPREAAEQEVTVFAEGRAPTPDADSLSPAPAAMSAMPP